jgi:hypothetical protein
MEALWIFFTLNNKQIVLFAAKKLASLAGLSMLGFCCYHASSFKPATGQQVDFIREFFRNLKDHGYFNPVF